MATPITHVQHFEFVCQLAEDLSNGEISLPSFPDVVVKIRKLLEDEDCNFGQVSQAVSTDAVLVSRLFVFANSAYHNRSEERVESLDVAVSRLGIDLVRNTALALALKQLLLAAKHKSIVGYLSKIWERSMQIASMSYAVALQNGDVEEEAAFMCGLLHEIGMLYILQKAKDFPDFLGDEGSLNEVLCDWHSQVGRAIVESWRFSEEVIESMDPAEFLNKHTHVPPALVDVLFVANYLLNTAEDSWPEQIGNPSFQKLRLDEAALLKVVTDYQEKLRSVQQSLN
jgi:HD-like signal output (HDOD) protein